MASPSVFPPAGLFRRLAALFYDVLIIIAIEMIAGGIVVAILEALVVAGVVDYSPYSDASDLLTRHPVWSPAYTAYLVLVWVWFFVFFWTRGGQTLGMRAWKLIVQNEQGGKITVTQALIRLAVSGFGLGNLTVPFDRQKRSLQDMCAKTQVVVLPFAR